MTAALLRTRLALEAPHEVADGAGGIVRSFVDAGAVWAELTPLTMSEALVADRALGRLTHRIRIRARADLTTTHRLRLGTRLFHIRALRETEPAGRFLDLLVEEEQG